MIRERITYSQHFIPSTDVFDSPLCLISSSLESIPLIGRQKGNSKNSRKEKLSRLEGERRREGREGRMIQSYIPLSHHTISLYHTTSPYIYRFSLLSQLALISLTPRLTPQCSSGLCKRQNEQQQGRSSKVKWTEVKWSG